MSNVAERISLRLSNSMIAFSISVIFSMIYFLFFILPSNSFKALISNQPPFFRDDRDGWLAFADAFPDKTLMEPLAWQLNFWPPGNIGILSLGQFVSGSIFGGAVFHVILVSLIQALLCFHVASLFVNSKKNVAITVIGSTLFHISFLYKSSFISTVLFSDYLSSIALALSVILAYKTIYKKGISKLDIFYVAFFLALAGYLRVTSFQITLIGICILLTVFISRIVRKKQSSIEFSRMLAILLVAGVLFAPWVAYRTFGIYDGDLARGIQFSAQGRFALSHQWDTPSYLTENPSLKFMGLGTACKVDKNKCKWILNRQNKILDGTLPRTLEDEWDLQSREALKTLVENPITWLRYKLKYFGQSYFQKSVYDAIDARYHFSIDLVLIILLLPWIAISIFKLSHSSRKVFILATISTSMFLATQLLITQSLLRFFLPSIMLILVTAVLLLSIKAKDKLDNRQK